MSGRDWSVEAEAGSFEARGIRNGEQGYGDEPECVRERVNFEVVRPTRDGGLRLTVRLSGAEIDRLSSEAMKDLTGALVALGRAAADDYPPASFPVGEGADATALRPDDEGIYPDCTPGCDVRGGAIHASDCPHRIDPGENDG